MIDKLVQSIVVILVGAIVWMLCQALFPLLPLLIVLLPIVGIVIVLCVVYSLYLLWVRGIQPRL